MATVLEELLIALRVDDGKLKSELSRIVDQARKAGGEGEKALKPFETGLSRMAAEARAGLRPLSDLRAELKKQEADLKSLAAAQDKNSGEYRKTVEQLTSVKRELASVTTELKTQESLFDKLGGTMTRVGGVLSLGVTAPLTILGATGVRSAQQLEVFQRSLETLTGDAESARDVFEELYEFDTSTTFSWPSLTKATTLLAAFNVESQDLIPTLSRLGDISAAVNMNIDELAEIYGKAKVQGRLFMEDINQLSGRGIPIVQELAAQFGVAESEIRGMVAEGKVGFSDIEQAFVTMTSEGGRFFEMMKTQTDTSEGRMMALRKEFEQVTDLIGDALIPTVDRLVASARSAVQWFVDLDERTQQLIINVGLFAAALGPLLIGLGQAVRVVGQLRTAFVALRAAGLLMAGPTGWVVLGVTAIGGLAIALSGRGDSLDAKLEKVRAEFDNVKTALGENDSTGVRSALKELVTHLDGPAKDAIQRLIDKLAKVSEVTEAMLLDVRMAVLQAEAIAERSEVEIRLKAVVERNAALMPAEFEAADTIIRSVEGRGGRANVGASEQAQFDRAQRVMSGTATADDWFYRQQREQDELWGRLEFLSAQAESYESAVQRLLNAPEKGGNAGKTPPPPGGEKVKSPAEVMAELEATRRQAHGVALAHGETLEALAAETQTMIGATTKAIDGLIAAAVDPQDEQVQKLITDLGNLKTESDRLITALKPTQLTAGGTAEVRPEFAAGQQAIAEYEKALQAIDVRRSLGLTDEEEALQEHLAAAQSAVDKLVPIYGALTDEQRAFVTEAIGEGARLASELERLEQQAELSSGRASRNRERSIARQIELDDDNATAAGGMSAEETKAWVAEYRAAQAEVAKQKRLSENALRRDALNVQAEAYGIGAEITAALRAGSMEGVEDLEALVLARLEEFADSSLGVVFAGLLTRARAAKAALEAEAAEAQRRSAESATTQEQMRLAQSRRWSSPGALEAFTNQAARQGGGAVPIAMPSVFSGLDSEQTKFVEKVRGDLSAAMDLAASKAEALGEAYDLPKEQMSLMRAAVMDLIENGLDPASPAVQEFVDDFTRLGKAVEEAAAQEARLKAFGDAVTFAKDALGEMPGPLEANIATLQEYRNSLDLSEEGATALAVELDRLIAALEKLQGIENSGLRSFANDITNLASSLPGLGGMFARSTGLVAEGLHKIAETDDKLEGTALVIRGVTTAIEGITAAASDGGLNGNQIMELIGGIASVAAEAIGTLTGIPGLGQVASAAFQLITLAVGDLSDGLAEIQEQVDQTAKSMPLLARETLDAFASEYTRQVSAGGSFGRTKAELDQEAYDAAVELAGSFANTFATALASADFEGSLDLGFDRMIRDQLIEAFILSPEVQAQIKALVEFWQDAWADGTLDDEERKRWERLKQGLIDSGQATREQLRELGLLEDEQTSKARAGGARITDLTGPARDHFADLLAPLRNLGAQLTALQDIRNILDARLPKVGTWSGATAAPGGGQTVYIDTVKIDRVSDARSLFDELSRIAGRLERGR